MKNVNCPVCKEVTVMVKEEVNHILHLIISLFFMPWLVIWLLIWVTSKYQCTKCLGRFDVL